MVRHFIEHLGADSVGMLRSPLFAARHQCSICFCRCAWPMRVKKNQFRFVHKNRPGYPTPLGGSAEQYLWLPEAGNGSAYRYALSFLVLPPALSLSWMPCIGFVRRTGV